MPVASFQNRHAIFVDMLHLYHPSPMSKTDFVSEISDFYSYYKLDCMLQVFSWALCLWDYILQNILPEEQVVGHNDCNLVVQHCTHDLPCCMLRRELWDPAHILTVMLWPGHKIYRRLYVNVCTTLQSVTMHRKSDMMSKDLNYWHDCNCYSTITHSHKVYSYVCNISAYQISHASLQGYAIYIYHGKVHLWS